MVYVWIALGALVLVFLFFSFYAFKLGTGRRDRTELFRYSSVAPSARIPFRDRVEKGVNWFEDQYRETLEITSDDGLKLKAELLPCENPKGVIVAMHGFRSWPSREFALIAKLLYEQGYTVLYPYQRAHRLSQGDYITFGAKEQYDCQQWAQVLSLRYPELPLFLYGQSMGASTVLLAGALPLPRQIRGLIADCGYTNPAGVIRHVLRTAYKVPPYPLLWCMDLWARLLGHYSFYEVNTLAALDKTSLPCLFIHGTADDLVPYEMGRANAERCHTEKDFLTVKDAGHCASWYVGEADYRSHLLAFLQRPAGGGDPGAGAPRGGGGGPRNSAGGRRPPQACRQARSAPPPFVYGSAPKNRAPGLFSLTNRPCRL